MQAMKEQLSGSVERIFFTNQSSGWTTFKLTRGERVKGTFPGIQEGQAVRCEGQWQDDPKWGRQFAAHTISVALPSDKDGIAKLLSSDIDGIGEKVAAEIVAHFGGDTLDVIAQTPERLREIKGIGEKTLARIIESFRPIAARARWLAFLRGIGLTAAQSEKVFEFFAKRSGELEAELRKNPYQLTEIGGIGFLTADAVARKLGIPTDSDFRIDAGVRYALDEIIEREGHCAYPPDKLAQRAGKLLEVDPSLVRKGIARNMASGALVEDMGMVYQPDMLLAEQSVCSALSATMRLPPMWDGLPDIKINNRGLNALQRAAAVMAVNNKVSILTGGPGTGKTTAVRAITEVLEENFFTVWLSAPTGKAAKRIEETTRRAAATLHRIIARLKRIARMKEKRDDDDYSDDDADGTPALLVIDEFSMVDIRLFDWLLWRLPPTTALLLVGDTDQLPSVGPGLVLHDLLEAGIFPITRLTQIMRTEEGSGIAEQSARIRVGQMPEHGPDFRLLRFKDSAGIEAGLLRLLDNLAEEGISPEATVQVITPMKRAGINLGAHSLNQTLQARLNGDALADERRCFTFGSTVFACGDRVIHTKNNYIKGVMNGETGVVLRVFDNGLEVQYDGGVVSYTYEDIGELALSYALTVHRTQGSEYDVAIVLLAQQHWMLLQRNLLYTAVTRAKKRVYLLCEETALQQAVRNARQTERVTGLAERLRFFLAQAIH